MGDSKFNADRVSERVTAARPCLPHVRAPSGVLHAVGQTPDFATYSNTTAWLSGCSLATFLLALGMPLRASSVYVVGTTKMVRSVTSDVPPTMTQLI